MYICIYIYRFNRSKRSPRIFLLLLLLLRPLSSKLETNEPVETRFWLRLEPFSVQKASKQLEMFTPRSAAVERERQQVTSPATCGIPSGHEIFHPRVGYLEARGGADPEAQRLLLLKQIAPWVTNLGRVRRRRVTKPCMV